MLNDHNLGLASLPSAPLHLLLWFYEQIRELKKELGRRSQKESELEAQHKSLAYETEAQQQQAAALKQVLHVHEVIIVGRRRRRE